MRAIHPAQTDALNQRSPLGAECVDRSVIMGIEAPHRDAARSYRGAPVVIGASHPLDWTQVMRSTPASASHETQDYRSTKQECQGSDYERFIFKGNIQSEPLHRCDLLPRLIYTPMTGEVILEVHQSIRLS